MKTINKLYLEQHIIVEPVLEEYNYWENQYIPTPTNS